MGAGVRPSGDIRPLPSVRMPDIFGQIVTVATGTVGLLAILGLAYPAVVARTRPDGLTRQFALGVLFGLGTILAMLFPAEISPGVLADIRSVPLALAGPFGGPVALVVAGIMEAAYRLSLGGIGAWPSVAGIVAVVLIVLALCRWRGLRSRIGTMDLVVLSIAANAWLVALLFLPPAIRDGFLATAAAPVAISTSLGVLFLGALLSRERRRLAAEHELRIKAATDPLTGLPNRRTFQEELAAALRRTGRPTATALALIDIDHFKRINDSHGHNIGDDVLVRVAEILRGATRDGDVLARVGGEEFALILRDTSLTRATAMVERLRHLIAEAQPEAAGIRHRLSVSIGTALGRSGQPSNALFTAADEALYEAKRGGRNTIRVRDLTPRGVEANEEPSRAALPA